MAGSKDFSKRSLSRANSEVVSSQEKATLKDRSVGQPVGQSAQGQPSTNQPSSDELSNSLSANGRPSNDQPASRQPLVRYQPLVLLAVAFSVGILWDRYVGFGTHGFGAWLEPWLEPWLESGREKAGDQSGGLRGELDLLCRWLAAAGLLVFWKTLIGTRYVKAAAVLLMLQLGLVAGLWHAECWNFFPSQDISRFTRAEPGPAAVRGVLLKSPVFVPAEPPNPLQAIPSRDRSFTTLYVTAIRDKKKWRPASGNCLLVVEGTAATSETNAGQSSQLALLQAGSRVQVFAKLSRPKHARNPGEYDSAHNARAERRLAILRCRSPACVTLCNSNFNTNIKPKAWSFRTAIFFQKQIDTIRTHCEAALSRHLAPEARGLASTFLLGSKRELSNQTVEMFKKSGVIHLLVVSGMHLSVMGFGAMWLFQLGWFSRNKVLWLVAGSVVLYAFVVGFRPSVVRAMVVVLLGCLASGAGRPVFSVNLLAAAWCVMLFLNPADMFRVGPLLSFLATGVLLFYGQYVQKKRRARYLDPLERLIAERRPLTKKIAASLYLGAWQAVVATTSVWVVMLPIVLREFHLFTPVGILISPLMWPLLGGALIGSVGVILSSFCFPWGTGVIAWLTSQIIKILASVISLAAETPAGHRWMPGPAFWWIVGFYGVLTVGLLCWKRPRFRYKILAAAIFWVGLGLAVSVYQQLTHQGLVCSFISVGHGTAVLIKTPAGQHYLYDAGALTAPEMTVETISSYLWERNVWHLDGVFLSHADVDHYNALPGLLTRFNVAQVFVTPVMFDRFDRRVFSGKKPNRNPSSKQTGALEPYRRAPDILREAIEKAEIPLTTLTRGDLLSLGTEVKLRVIHPSKEGVLGTDNANSMTLILEYAGRKILLPGDLEDAGVDEVTAQLPVDCDLLLAPHHGSIHSDPAGFSAWCTPELVVFSSGHLLRSMRSVAAYQEAGATVFETARHGCVRLNISPTGKMEVLTHKTKQPIPIRPIK